MDLKPYQDGHDCQTAKNDFTCSSLERKQQKLLRD